MTKNQDLLEDVIKKKCFQLAQEVFGGESRVKIFLFGSRALGISTLRSDIDLGIDIGRPISSQKMVLIREAFDHLKILQKVDVVDFSTADSNFKKVASKKTTILYERKAA